MPKYQQNQQTVIEIIRSDDDMMSYLRFARQLNLPDWGIGAGFVRNKVWDTISGKKRRTQFEDIDVIYFNPKNTDENVDREFEKILTAKCPAQKWSVKNQARMWGKNGDKPYKSCEHAIQHWPETVTALAITLGKRDGLKLIAPYGLRDLFLFKVRPTPRFLHKLDVFIERQAKKNWQKRWKQITMENTF